MAIYSSYVKLPEGIFPNKLDLGPSSHRYHRLGALSGGSQIHHHAASYPAIFGATAKGLNHGLIELMSIISR